MELAVLLPIAAFIALAAGLVVVLRRAGRLVARTREVEVVQRTSATSPPGRTVARRCRRPDRCRPPAPAGARRDRRDARGRDRRRRALRDEARALRGPPARRTGSANDIVAELERAGRALEMVEHGTTMLARQPAARARGADVDQARLPQPAPRPRGDRAPRARRRRSCRRTPEADQAQRPCSVDRRRDHTI